MVSEPSRTLEAIVAVFIPPACREEVLGDLYERYRSPHQYGFDALRTVPFVILSRVRRTAEPQVVLMQAFASYLSFVGAAWLQDAAFLTQESGPWRLAIPAALVVAGVTLNDAYTRYGQRSPLQLARGPALGTGLALAADGIFRIIPASILFYGCAMSLLLSSAIRILLPPAGDQLRSASVPPEWLRHTSAASGVRQTRLGVWIVSLALVVFIGYQVWRRG